MIYIESNGLTMFTTSELKFNWRFMDKYGYDPHFTIKQLRKIKLKKLNGEEADIFDNNILMINLYPYGSLDFKSVSYRPENDQLKIEGLYFKVKSLVEAEYIVESFIKGSRLVLGDIYKK